MSKKRKSVTIDQSLARQIDRRSEINFSSLVNDLVQNYLAGDGMSHKNKAALEVQLQHIQEEIKEKEERLDELKKDEERLQQRIDEYENEQAPIMEEAIDVLQNTPDEELHPENEAVKNWVGKTGIPATALIERVKNERQ